MESKVGVSISVFVMNTGGKNAIRQGNVQIQKGDCGRRDIKGEFDGGMVVTDKVYVISEVRQRERGGTEAIIDVAFAQFRLRSSVSGTNLGFQVAHE